jgi:hypothetical protein
LLAVQENGQLVFAPAGKLERTAKPFPLREKTKWAGGQWGGTVTAALQTGQVVWIIAALNERMSDGDPEVTTGAGNVAAAVIEVQCNGPALPG